MEEYIVKDGKKLRLGYTTGSCAAAAAKAAAFMLLTGRKKDKINLLTPKGIGLDLAIHNITMTPGAVSCSVEKDSGDDPDITKGTHIFAEVSYLSDLSENDEKIRSSTGGNFKSENSKESSDPDNCAGSKTSEEGGRIVIDGGTGIGRVTKPGLDQPVGAAAINSVPRKMIREGLLEVMELLDYHGCLKVIISAPEGEELAKKTFNSRLGILGGLSILGTTGIVEPMSEQALVDTILLELRQRRENGAEYILLTPGNYGAEYIEQGIGMDPKSAVLTSNFIGDSLKMCRDLGFRGALLVGHIGKLVKLAGGMLNTHSKYGDCRMDIMTAHAACAGLSRKKAAEMMECVTCDDALRILKEEDLRGEAALYEKTLQSLQKKIDFIMEHTVNREMETGAVMFSRVYGYLCETKHAKELLEKIRSGK